LIADMKKARELFVQAINADGVPLTFSLPLAEFAFAKAYDGPPTDWKDIQENPEKLWRRLWKRYALRPKDDFKNSKLLSVSPNSYSAPPRTKAVFSLTHRA